MGPVRLRKIEVRRVVKSYGSTMALRGVDASLRVGQLTLVEGANGSGKTTLLGILGGVIRPTSGEVLFEPLPRRGEDARAQIGWLSHDTLGYGDLTGRQNVELVARMHGLAVGAAWTDAEERFELGAFARRPLRTCSRGQRQRVALARALVHRPPLVLLDEPTTGLDGAGVKRLLKVVDELVADGSGVCVVSHEPDLFRSRAKERILLERGKRVERFT